MSDDVTEREPPSPPEEESPKKKKSVLRRIGRGLLKVFAVLVGLLILLGIITQTQAFKDLLREQIVEATNNALVGKIELGAISGNLFTGVSVDDVKVYDKEGHLAVYVHRADVAYTLPALLKRRLVIGKLTLERPLAIMRYDLEGNLNLLQIAKESTDNAKSDPFGIELNGIKVEDAALLYLDERLFLTEVDPQTAAARDTLMKLLADPERLVEQGLSEQLHPILRDTLGLSQGPAPALALISELELETRVTIDTRSAIDVKLAPLSATLDANAFVRPQALRSPRLDVYYGPDAVRLVSEGLTLGESGDGLGPFKLGANFTPVETPDQLPYPELFFINAPKITLSRALFNQVLPSVDLRRGVQLEVMIAGTPQLAEAMVIMDALESDDHVHLYTALDALLSSLMSELNMPKPSVQSPDKKPSYTLDLKFSDLDPGAYLATLPQASLSAHLLAHGAGLDPRGDLTADAVLEIAPSQVAGWQVERGKLDLAYADETLTIRESFLQTPYADATLAGQGKLPGELDLTVTAKATERHQRQVDVPQVGIIAQKSFDLNAKLSAKTDVFAEDPIAALESLALDADWHVAQLTQGEIALGQSQGTLAFSLSPDTATTRDMKLDLDALVVDLDSPEARVGRAKAVANAHQPIPWPLDDPMALKDMILAHIDLQLTGLHAQGVHIGALSATLGLRPAGGGGLNYDLNVKDLRNFSYPQQKLRLERLRTDMKGQVELSKQGELRFLSAKGDGSLSALDYDTQHVGRADFDVDVAGVPPLLRGKVRLSADDLEVGGEELVTAEVNAELKQGGDFQLDAQAERKNGSPHSLRVNASGNVSDDLSRISDLDANIYNLDVDDKEPIWRLSDATITSRGGDIAFENLSLENGEQKIAINGTYRKRGAQDLKVTASKVDIGQLREQLGLNELIPDVRGEVETIDLSLSGTSRNPELSIDVILRRFYYEQYGPFDLVLKGRYEDDRLTVNTLDLDGYGMDMLRAQARVPLHIDLEGNTRIFWSENILLTMFIDPIDLDELSGQIPDLKKLSLSGKIEGGGILNGTLREPTLDMNVKTSELSVKGEFNGQQLMIDRLDLSTRFEYEPPKGAEGGFILTAQLARGPRSLFTLSSSSPIPIAEWIYETVEKKREIDYVAQIIDQPYFLNATFDRFELSELSRMGLTQQLQLAGVLDLKVHGNGTFKEPDLQVDTTLTALTLQGTAGGQQLDIRDIDTHSTLLLDGRPGRPDPLTLQGTMSWKGAPLGELDAKLQLPFNDWITRLAAGESVDIAMEALERPFDLHGVITRLDLSELAVAPLLKESDAAGVITASLDASGTLRKPKGELAIDIGELTCTSVPGEQKPCLGLGWDRYRDIVISARMKLEDEILDLERLLVNWDDLDVFEAKGTLPVPVSTLLDGTPPDDLTYDMTLDLKTMPLNKLSAIDYTFASLTGAIKGKVHLQGSLRKPNAVGCMALLDARLGEQRQSKGTIGLQLDAHDGAVVGALKFCQTDRIEQDVPRVCSLEPDNLPPCDKGETLLRANVAARANTDLIALSKGAKPLVPDESTRMAQGPLRAEDDLFVSIHTRQGQPLDLSQVLPMKLIEGFAREVKGKLAIDVDVQGSYEAPVPTGDLSLEGGSVLLPDLGRRFDAITVDADMDATYFTLKELSLREGRSSVAMNAKLAHEKLSPKSVSAKLRADEFDVGSFVDFPFFATGDVDMTGDLSGEPMDLNVDVSNLTIQLTEDLSSNLHPTDLDSDVIVLRRDSTGRIRRADELEVADTELTGESSSFLDTLKLRTRVKIGRDTWVRHPYGQVNLMGDVTALMQGSTVTMGGQIEALRGQAEFLGKIFRVQRALITFTGADPPDPRLQIEAIYELDQSIVQDLGPASDGQPKIVIAISGPSSEPVLKLSSDPPMGETDIIYVLATNRPPGTAGVGQDSSVASAALSAASGLLVGMLKDELSDNLPLDFFDVLNVDTSNFEIGKYVYNGKIYLSYRYLFGSSDRDGQSIYEFQFNFQPRWTFEAQGRDGQLGGQLNLNLFWDAF